MISNHGASAEAGAVQLLLADSVEKLGIDALGEPNRACEPLAFPELLISFET
jgi:hypothetical protein